MSKVKLTNIQDFKFLSLEYSYIAKLVIERRYLEPYIFEDVYAELRVINNAY